MAHRKVRSRRRSSLDVELRLGWLVRWNLHLDCSGSMSAPCARARQWVVAHGRLPGRCTPQQGQAAMRNGMGRPFQMEVRMPCFAGSTRTLGGAAGRRKKVQAARKRPQVRALDFALLTSLKMRLLRKLCQRSDASTSVAEEKEHSFVDFEVVADSLRGLVSLLWLLVRRIPGTLAR